MTRSQQYYHVRITPKSNPENVEVVLDLNFEQLEHQFIVPYGQAKPIVINGKTVAPDDLDRIQINETHRNSWEVDADLKAFESEMGIAHPPDEIRYPTLTLARQGTDVTNKYISVAPGQALDSQAQSRDEIRPTADTRDVFVVHGRNEKARAGLFEFLRAIDLHPLEWSHALRLTEKGSPYVGEALDAAFSHAHAIVVLFTPDDEVRLKRAYRKDGGDEEETELSGQARPNVLFEAGMALGRDENRTILVELGNLRAFSDIVGRHTVRPDKESGWRSDLANRLKTAGCPVKLDNRDWETAGNLDAALTEESSDAEGPTSDVNGASQTELSEGACNLLLAAANEDERTIVVLRAGNGAVVRIGPKTFVDAENAREVAKWEAVIQELLATGLITPYRGGGEAYDVTERGFEFADVIRDEVEGS